MKTSTQLKALIRNMSKEKNINAEIILRNFMLERLLERISLSPLREKFILKGGMLVAAMVGIDTRSTMDMDATIRGITFSEETLKKALETILSYQIFLIIIRLKDEKESNIFPYLARIEKSLKDQEFAAKRADNSDIKRFLGVYYEQNVTIEKYEDYDGERWVVLGDV